MPLQFEWNGDKAESNIVKHGISFAEAATIFGDAKSITIDDPNHSQQEIRLVTLGKSHSAQILVVVHTERGDNTRIISARRANQNERKKYEES